MSKLTEARTQYDAIANSAPQPGNFYNQSFVDRITAAQRNIDNLVADRDKAYSSANQAKGEYDSFTGNMRSYTELHEAAENEFGVKQAQDDYEKSKSALAMTESVLEALPSSISARSGRVLTQEQRNLAYGRQADIVNRTQSNLSEATNAYEQAWRNARENQAAKAQAEMAVHRQNQQTLNAVWAGELNNFNQLQQNVSKSEMELLQEREAYQRWQNQQWQNEFAIWNAQLAAATQRVIEAIKSDYNETLASIQGNYLQGGQKTQNKTVYYDNVARAGRYSGGGGGGGGGGGW